MLEFARYPSTRHDVIRWFPVVADGQWVPSERTWYLRGLVVYPKFRQQGWATQFLGLLLRELRRRYPAINAVELDNCLDNPTSRLYHRVGFVSHESSSRNHMIYRYV